jgi:hypothetical protein
MWGKTGTLIHVLGPLVLASSHSACGYMSQSDSWISGVHALASRATGSVGVHSNITDGNTNRNIRSPTTIQVSHNEGSASGVPHVHVERQGWSRPTGPDEGNLKWNISYHNSILLDSRQRKWIIINICRRVYTFLNLIKFSFIMGVHIMLTIPLPVPLSKVKQHLVKPVLR